MSLSKTKNNLQNTYRRSFPDSKEGKFVKCLEENLSDIDFNLNPNQIMDNILLATKNAINQVFPIKKVSRKQAKLIQNPWMTNEIIKEGKLRDKLQKKSVESRNAEDYNKYKKQRNKVNRLVRDAKRKNIKSDCEKCKGNSKKMWKR